MISRIKKKDIKTTKRSEKTPNIMVMKRKSRFYNRIQRMVLINNDLATNLLQYVVNPFIYLSTLLINNDWILDIRDEVRISLLL